MSQSLHPAPSAEAADVIENRTFDEIAIGDSVRPRCSAASARLNPLSP